MAPTDLLDMFNPRPAKGSSPARATSRARDGAPRSSARSTGAGAGRKRVLLGGAVMVLLLALAFTAGVGVGRTRRPAVTGTETVALAAVKPVETWGIRGRTLPSLGLNATSLKVRVFEDFVRRWPEFSNLANVSDVLDKTGKVTGQFRLVLRGFESRSDAQAMATELGVWAVDGYLPFNDCRPERMSEPPR